MLKWLAQVSLTLFCNVVQREEDYLAKVWKECRLLEAHLFQELEVLDLQGCAPAKPATPAQHCEHSRQQSGCSKKSQAYD